MYHGVFKERVGIDYEFVRLEGIKNVGLMSVMIELIQRHDQDESLLFGTKNIMLGKTFKIKINGTMAFAFGELLHDGDLIDICPVLEGEEYE